MSVNLQEFAQRMIVDRIDIFGIVVRQHGDIAGSFFWNDCGERRNNINSCTKSITSMAVGIAVSEGVLSLEERPADIFAGELPDDPQPWLFSMSIRDMLTMTTGHDHCLLARRTRDALTEKNWTRICMREPLAFPPGVRFQYNNMGSYLVSVIIQDRVGQSIHHYLKPRLFEPMGIRNTQWFECPRGYTLGMGGLHLTTYELAKIAQLCLHGGVWEGRRLVPAEYLQNAVSCQIADSDFEESPTKDFHAGYGYLFWRNSQPGSYGGFGNMGQIMLALPEYDAAIGVTAHEGRFAQKIYDGIWDTILPQL